MISGLLFEDNLLGGRRATLHIARLGRTRILFPRFRPFVRTRCEPASCSFRASWILKTKTCRRFFQPNWLSESPAAA